MHVLSYPVVLKKAKDGVTVRFPDLPYGTTFGESKEEALYNAIDCLEEIIASLMKDKKDIPTPSPSHRRPMIVLSPTFSAKVLLYNVMREQGVTKSELARRLKWKYPQVERLFDAHHKSRMSQLVAAAGVLGKKYVIGMIDRK